MGSLVEKKNEVGVSQFLRKKREVEAEGKGKGREGRKESRKGE